MPKNGSVKNNGTISWTSDAMDKAGDLFAQARQDGWINVLTGLGTSRDKRVGMTFQPTSRITNQKELLEEMYHGDDIVSTFVDLPAQEATREWIDVMVQGENEGYDVEIGSLIMQELEAIGARDAITAGLTWSRLYGGSVVLLGVDDGETATEPLNLDAVKSIDWLTVLDRFDVYVDSYYTDPTEPKYGLPKMYRIQSSAYSDSTPYGTLIHESRTLRFDGTRTSIRRRQENAGWAESVLGRTSDVIRDFQAASQSIANLLQDFSQATFKIKGLAKALAADKDGLVIKRLQMLDIARSIVRAVPLDEDEEFERKGAGVQGMSDLYDRQMMRVSAATRIPVTLLFGRSPAGMNSTGESDIRLFYDHVAAMQEAVLRPRLEYLLTILLNSSDGPTGGVEPESWGFEFNPLFQENAKEKAEARLAVARSDDIYLGHGVLTSDEVALSRFGGDKYSAETSLDKDERAETEQEKARLRILTEARDQIDSREDVPGYGLQTDEAKRADSCRTCAFADGNYCDRWSFAVDVGYVCDDHMRDDGTIQMAPRKEKKILKQPRGRNC